MKKIYTISRQSYDDISTDIYTDRAEWEKAIDTASEQEYTQGKGRGIDVSIYEIPDDTQVSISSDRGWTGKEYRGRRVYANHDKIIITKTDENGDEVEEEIDAPVETQKINYWYISQIEAEDDENNGKWASDRGEIYDTEEEGRELEKPSQYLIF